MGYSAGYFRTRFASESVILTTLSYEESQALHHHMQIYYWGRLVAVLSIILAVFLGGLFLREKIRLYGGSVFVACVDGQPYRVTWVNSWENVETSSQRFTQQLEAEISPSTPIQAARLRFTWDKK